MTDRHDIARHRIALLNGVLVSTAVKLDASIDAAIAAEAAKAGVEIDRHDVETTVVYLSDVQYPNLLVAHGSGEGGHLGTADGEYAYAYDADHADEEAAKVLERRGSELGRMLHNLEIETAFAGNIANDWSTPLRDGTLDTLDALEMRRALELRPQVQKFVDDYIWGCDAQPDIDEVLNDLDEKGELPEYDYWIADPFVVAAAALAMDVIDDADFSAETAETALKARDEDLMIVGRDPARDHQIQIGREINERGTWVSVMHFKNYRSVVAWAEDDRNFDGTFDSNDDHYGHHAA